MVVAVLLLSRETLGFVAPVRSASRLSVDLTPAIQQQPRSVPFSLAAAAASADVVDQPKWKFWKRWSGLKKFQRSKGWLRLGATLLVALLLKPLPALAGGGGFGGPVKIVPMER